MTIHVTGVGSLPHRDPVAAAEFVLATTDVPYLPQLPLHDPAEGMLAQWGDGLAGCGAEPGGLGLRHGIEPRGRAAAFGGAAALLAALPPGTPLVKTQATGPVTLATALRAGGAAARGLWDAVVGGLVARIGAHVDWVAARLPAAEVVLVLDEPALAGLPIDGFPVAGADAEAALRATLAALPVPAGIHCCGDTDWGMVARLRPRWLSWDVGALGPGFAEGADDLAAAVAAGTGVIWGVAPTAPPPLPAPEDLVGRFRRVEGALLVAGAPADRLAADTWLTPACGLAGVGEAHAATVAATVRDVAGEVRVAG